MNRRSIVSSNTRLRHPELLAIGEGSIIDDFCYISTRVTVGRFSHIASGCSIAGGAERLFELGDFSSLSSGVKIWCTSDDFAKDMVTIIPPDVGDIKTSLITGDVIFNRLTAVGSNAVVMPQNRIPEGTVIGALSFVPPSFPFEEWSVYAGVPIRKVGVRNRQSVLHQMELFEARIAKIP